MSIGQRSAHLVLLLVMMSYAAVAVPGLFKAADNSAAVGILERDAPRNVLPPLMDLYDGQLVPNFCAYGHLPAYFTGTVFAPLLAPMKLLSGRIDYMWFVVTMRASQLLMAALAVFYLFRLARLCLPAWLSLAAAMCMLTMAEFQCWTLSLHPDIYQAATFIAAMYYLVLYQQTGGNRQLYISAVFAGLATAAKYYGVFIIPAAVWTLLSCRIAGARLLPGTIRFVVKKAALYCAIVIAVFLLLNLRILCFSEDVHAWLERLREFHAARDTVAGELLTGKIANIVSTRLLGPIFTAAYLLCAAAWGLDVLRRLRRGAFVPDAYQAIHVSALVFAVYYFAVYDDGFNLFHGERYLLPFVCVAPLPVLLTLYRMSGRQRLRLAVAAVAVVLAASAGLRVIGRPLDIYRPTPVAMNRPIYDSIFYAAAEADQRLLAGCYDVQGGTFDRARLRPGISPEQIVAIRDFWLSRTSLLGYPLPCWHWLKLLYHREDRADFKIRAWVKAYVPKDSVIYADGAMNLLPTETRHVDYADNEDLPTKRINVGRVTPEAIREYRPDYIFTLNQGVADRIRADDSRYVLVKRLTAGNVVHILGRSDWPHEQMIRPKVKPFEDYVPVDAGAGSVDSVVSAAHAHRFKGWAVDHLSGTPAAAVLIVHDGKTLAAFAADEARPDVAEYFKQPGFVNSGWEGTIQDKDLPAANTSVEVWAVLRDDVHVAPLISGDQDGKKVFELRKTNP
jgi:hypothetical protein